MILAKNGQEAYENCRNNDKIDLVIMDWLMPVMDGETSTKLIKQLGTGVPVLAVTAFATEDKQREILQSGCNAYFSKPVNSCEILDYINTLIGK